MMRVHACSRAFLMTVVACSDSTKPVDPATVTSASLTPATAGVVKGSTQSLTLSAHDTSGNEVRINANWTSSAPSIATVSSSGVVSAVNYGSATITATVGTRSATATVVVTSAPTVKSYSILDLGTGTELTTTRFRQLSDSGDVLAGPQGMMFRHGTLTTLNGCPTPWAVNSLGHVLCRINTLDSVSSYAVWHDGIVTAITRVDTLKAQNFRALALNDSDVVAGLMYGPLFSNPGCARSSIERCLVLWSRGSAAFPGVLVSSGEAMYLNNRLQVVLEDPIYTPSSGQSAGATVYDASTHVAVRLPAFVYSLNDQGWAALIAQDFLQPGSRTVSTAMVATNGGTVVLGPGFASGINSSNVVVGTLTVGPFIWRDGAVSLLTNAASDPAWTITAADEINARGQILGSADKSDGTKGHLVLLTPIQP